MPSISNVSTPTSVARLLIVLALAWLASTAGCGDTSTGPSTLPAGLKGRVYDADGRPVPNAQIFLSYSYWYLPQEPYFSGASVAATPADSFAFALGQPFPNPLVRSLYVRFSIPADGAVEVSILDGITSEPMFTRSDSLSAGWYQWYLPDIVPSLRLTNGLYDVRLRFVSRAGGETMTMSRNVLVISIEGRANAVADADGQFSLSYDAFCVGDSTLTTNNDKDFTPAILSATSHAYVVAGGIREVVADLQVVAGVVLQRDIVLDARMP